MTDPQTPRYSIFFNGELLANTSREAALETLTLLTNTASEDLLDRLFSVKPVIVTQTADEQLAQQYEQQFRDAGLDVLIQPYDESHDDIINAELSFGHYAPLETQQTAPNYVLDTLTASTSGDSQNSSPEGRYQVIFEGQLLGDIAKETAVENLSYLTNACAPQVLEEVFSVIPVIIWQGDELDVANFYQASFRSAGLITEVFGSDLLGFEIQARSQLLIRDDKPAPLMEKPVQRFTYTLLGLTAFAMLMWALIYVTFDSFFSHSNEPVLQVELTRTAAVSEPLAAANKQSSPQPATKHKTSSASKAAKPKAKPKNRSASQSNPAVSSTDNKKLQGKRDDYYLELLSWFAQYQQTQPSQSKTLQGEIRLQVTILRDGKVKKITVLSSNSEQLSSIIVQQAQAASPFPTMPAEIKGSKYTFDLPLRYTLDK